MEQAKLIPVIRCAACGAAAIQPQYVCGECGDLRFEPSTVPGEATVYSHTTIRVAPESYRDQVPYIIVIADLAPGLRVTARLAGEEERAVEVGEKLSFDRIDENSVYWFRKAK